METLIALLGSAFASGGGAWIAIKFQIERMDKDIKENRQSIRELRSLYEALRKTIKRERAAS